jgi:hypothetical protein
MPQEITKIECSAWLSEQADKKQKFIRTHAMFSGSRYPPVFATTPGDAAKEGRIIRKILQLINS